MKIILSIVKDVTNELESATFLTERFTKMCIDELSVAPSMVLGVCRKICEME